jgi:hypothetical protein
MWNGTNPSSQQQRDVYATNDTSRNTDQNRSNSHQINTMVDDQLHMDAVSALTSLQGSGVRPSTTIPSQLVRALSSSNGSMPYVSATVAGTAPSTVIAGNSMVSRHYSDDYTALSQPQQPHFDDQLIGNGGLYSHHSYHRPPMYGSNSGLNGGVVNGHSALHQQQMSAVLSPYAASLNYGGGLPSVVPQIHAPPVMPTSMSRQPSSTMPTSLSVALSSSLHPNQKCHHSEEMVKLSSSTVMSSEIQRPLYPFDRPTSSEPMPEYNSIYHPAHPNDLPSNRTEDPVDMDDGEDDDMEQGNEKNEIVGDTDRNDDDDDDDDDDNDVIDEEQAIVKDDEDDEEVHEETTPIVENVAIVSSPRGKPEAAALALAASKLDTVTKNESIGEDNIDNHVDGAPVAEKPKKVSHSPSKKSPNKKPTSRKKVPATSNGGVSSMSTSVLLTTSPTMNTMPPKREFLLGENVPQMSDAEYNNLKEMMIQFCRVPLLSEFSRPVALLHPEVRFAT